MAVELIHTSVGLVFFAVWVMAGQILVSNQS